MPIITVTNTIPNRQHISRPEEEKLSHVLNEKGIAIISGKSKTGKTEIAREYCFKPESEYQYCFWLCGSSREELLFDLTQMLQDPDAKFICDEMEALGVQLKDQDLDFSLAKLKRIFEKLSASWLIIIDDLGIKHLDTLLPIASKDKKHHVIIAVSDNNKGLLSPNAPTAIAINEFTLEECEKLFAKRLLGDEKISLSDADKSNIKTLMAQLGNDLEILIIASRIYSDLTKREQLLKVNENKTLTTSQIQTELSLMEISVDQAFLKSLYPLALFESCSVPLQWVSLKDSDIQFLTQYEVLTCSKKAEKITLTSLYQAQITAVLESTATAFQIYDALYKDLLANVMAEFTWTRTHYNKKLKAKNVPESYAKEQSDLAVLARALLTKFAVWQKKASPNNFNLATVLPTVQLTNSLGRYYFIQEWFVQALEYYQVAKERFDLLLETDQQKQLAQQNRDKAIDKPIYRAMLKKYGYAACLVYAQEVLHNIGATIVKISWDDTEKVKQLDIAVQVLQLSYDWQMHLIKHFDQTAIPFIRQQLGLGTTKNWTDDELKSQLYHFANFTRRVLAQAYIQQKQYAEAEIVYQALIKDKHYMDRPETKPLAYRDLANVQRRQNDPQNNKKLDEALTSIEMAIPLLKVTDFPVNHLAGEKEQVLYERAKIYMALKQLENAAADFKKIIETNSISTVYKVKTYYQLAKIAKQQNRLLGELSYLEKAIELVKDRSAIKQKAYEQYHLGLISQLTDEDKDTLKIFGEQLFKQFLITLNQTIADLRAHPDGHSLKLAMGIIESIFKLVPDAEVGIPNVATVKANNPLPGAINNLSSVIAEYRKAGRTAELTEIEAIEQELKQSVHALASLIAKQYGSQLLRLAPEGRLVFIKQAIDVLMTFIKEGKILTKEKDFFEEKIEEQLLAGLLENMPTTKLVTSKPTIDKNWNARGLVNKPAFFVSAANTATSSASSSSVTTEVAEAGLYARRSVEQDRHEKYGYGLLKKAPSPTGFYKKYQTEAEIVEAKKVASEARASNCAIM